jgi:hypothetical protein
MLLQVNCIFVWMCGTIKNICVMCCMYVDNKGWKCRHKSAWELEHYIFITFVSSNCAHNHLKYLKLKHWSNEKLCELWIKIWIIPKWHLSFLWETCVLLKVCIYIYSLNLNYLHIFSLVTTSNEKCLSIQ